MPVTFDWADDNQQFYLVGMEAPWTWAELEHEVIFSQIEAVSHPVVLVFDVNAKGFPKGDILGHFKSIEKSGESSTNISNVTIVGAPYLAKTFTNIYQKLRHNTKQPPVYFAETVELALVVADKTP